MSLIPKTELRRSLIALAAFAAVTAVLAAPAAADGYRRGGRHWHSQHPRVGVYVGIPPIVLVAGRPAPYYGGGYERRYDDRRERAYDRGYEDGYDDGYDDRAREEWRRRHYHAHHHDDCDY